MAEMIIHSDNFTDANGEIHYFNTGKDNVSGLSFPDHYIMNKDNYKYTRILEIIPSPDTSLIYPIHECFLLTTYESGVHTGKTNIVNIDAIAREGTVSASDIHVSCTPLDYADGNQKIHDIAAAVKSSVVNGSVVLSIGIWLNTEGIIDILIKDLSSIGINKVSNNIYHEFLMTAYESHYLNNEDVMYEINMFNIINSIGDRIATGRNVNQKVMDKLENMADGVQSAIPDYQFLSVIYDDLYSISSVNTDEIIKPTAFQYVEVGNSFGIINDNYFSVNDEGNYLLALKVNMDIHEGMPTKMTMSLFLNDDRVEETTCTLYLDPNNKVAPLGFLSGQLRIHLNKNDKLYLKARWTDKDSVFVENHCTLQVTKLNSIK